MDRKFMEEATRLAIESVEKGWGGPFGAVIVKDGEIIGRGQNRVLLTGCPIFHAEIAAIIDASSRLNPKALLGSDYHACTMLEMIPRPPGSPDLVPQRARMLKGCEIYINGAPCPWHQGNAELRTRGRPAGLPRLGEKAGSPPVLTRCARCRGCNATKCAAVNPPLTTERANRMSQPAKSSRPCGDNRDCRSTARSDAPPWPIAHGVRAFPHGTDHRLADGAG